VVRPRHTCRARRRPPTHPLTRPRWTVPHVVEVATAHGFTPSHRVASVSSVIPMDAHIHRRGLDFKQSSLGHIRRVPKRIALDASRRPPRFRHALVPSRFRAAGKPADPGTSLQFLPAARGIQRSASRRTPAVRLSTQRAPHGFCRRAGARPGAGDRGAAVATPGHRDRGDLSQLDVARRDRRPPPGGCDVAQAGLRRGERSTNFSIRVRVSPVWVCR
jgi:hypothetical protein